ncbi:MAG: insulinase family protein [Candidatus Neomarinimicrobiota bacterium]
MNRSRLSWAIFAILLLLGCEAPAPSDTTGFIVNGLKVVFKRTPGRPLVTAGFYLKGGVSYASTGQAGLEPLLLSALSAGTETLRRDEIDFRLDALSATLEVTANYDYAGLVAGFPRENWALAWELFADILLHPRLDPNDLDRIRRRVISTRVATPTTPGQDAARNANGLYYRRHVYRLEPWGGVESLSALERKDLVQYYRADVTKSRALLVVVGDLDIADLTNRVRWLAKQLPLGPDMLPPALTFDPGPPEVTVARRDLPLEYITGLFGAPRPGHPDFPAFTVAMILLQDLLDEELRGRRQLADNPIAGVGERFFNCGWISLTTTQPRQAVEAVFELLDRLTANPVPPEMLPGRIAVALANHYRRTSTVAGIRDLLTHWEIVGESWEKSGQFIPELKLVRPEQVQFVIRKYVRGIHFGVVGNPRKIPRNLFKSR